MHSIYPAILAVLLCHLTWSPLHSGKSLRHLALHFGCSTTPFTNCPCLYGRSGNHAEQCYIMIALSLVATLTRPFPYFLATGRHVGASGLQKNWSARFAAARHNCQQSFSERFLPCKVKNPSDRSNSNRNRLRWCWFVRHNWTSLMCACEVRRQNLIRLKGWEDCWRGMGRQSYWLINIDGIHTILFRVAVNSYSYNAYVNHGQSPIISRSIRKCYPGSTIY